MDINKVMTNGIFTMNGTGLGLTKKYVDTTNWMYLN